MKKLTFIEALKVNETRRVMEIISPANRPSMFFEPNEMVKSCVSIRELAKSEWTTEPEKFEFECDWHMVAGVIYPVCTKDISKLVGKKTKVTVEVIDD